MFIYLLYSLNITNFHEVIYCELLKNVKIQVSLFCSLVLLYIHHISFQGFQVTLTALKNIVAKKVNERTKVIGKFNEQINKDITAVLTEVADIKEEANVSCVQFINCNINAGKVFYNTA